MNNRNYEADNTVSAKGQLAPEQTVTGAENTGVKILFIGNSITLHGINHDIGWPHLWGMAASAEEKDYVHQTVRMAREVTPDISWKIAQVSEWEIAYWEGESVLEQYREAADWNADILVMRFGENISPEKLDQHPLVPEILRLFDFFNPHGTAKTLVTTLFWPHGPKNDALLEAAKIRNFPVIDISELGTRDDMKAIGLFEHAGVAAHPGDLGMLTIAEAVFAGIRPMLP